MNILKNNMLIDIGTEYFEGDIEEMKKDFMEIIDNYILDSDNLDYNNVITIKNKNINNNCENDVNKKKEERKYICEKCKFETTSYSNYYKHKKTEKHN